MDARQEEPRRRTQAERLAATRSALVESAQRLFGERGFAGVSTEEIVRDAGVTRGALYHHFRDKRDLFVAVFDKIEADSTNFVLDSVKQHSDASRIAIGGARAYLEFCRDPAVQRLMFVEARAVIDDETLNEIIELRGGTLIRSMILALVEQGVIARGSTDALVAVVGGMLIEGAVYVGRAEDQGSAVDEVTELFEALIRGLAAA